MTRRSFPKPTARSFALISIVVAVLSSIGCSAGEAGARWETEKTGSVGLALLVSPGVSVTAGTYNITGPNGFVAAGTVAVGQTADVSLVVSGLPIGSGYSLTVTAMADDGVTACTGAAPFDVAGGASSTVVVHLVCRVPANAGRLLVMSDIDACPTIDSMGASPAEVLVGAALDLSAAAHDADGAPAALTYAWSASDGSLSTTSQPNPSFTCTNPGVVAIDLTVSDGNATCNDSLALTVWCTAP
jgi:hypothetical protein